MPDFAKCTDSKCPSRETCLRWTAKAGDHQCYADFNREPEQDKCEHYEPEVIYGRQ